MDKRIIEKLNTIKQTEKELEASAAQKKVEAEARHKAYIESKVPEARKWVEDRLLDLIAQEMAKPDRRDGNNNRIKKFLSLEYCDSENNGNRSIPEESKYLAVKEIDGLIAEKEWISERPDPNSEGGYMLPACYIYSVTWKQ